MSRRKSKQKQAQKTKPPADDDDESFADRAIQAELDHAMGIENDDYDWLVDPYK